ncbi:MAG TPA: sugar phosphate isomerase/epimerase family protein [Planctomycetota bacterium]|nr:sugar phosphate isomerase/epimerase family protein [Planctomycetota bacterium]HRR79959.1 sugar phosphate isomerase/epimerase family protein [Planctomycetota bacterium]HRT95751.1 sugar phosphate isomerase/epimerase family protein [Planctomycetota bacterium]
MDRREFLRRSAGTAALATAAGQVLAAEEAKKETAVLKLGSQAGRIPGKTLRDKVLQLQDWGGVGLELGGGGNVKEIQEAIKGTTVKVSACCWGSAGGALVSPDKEKRDKGIEQIKAALKFGGEVESTGVIFVPCFNGQSTLKPEELDKVLADILPAIGDYAVEQKCRVLLEPLNVGETFYLRRLEQAAAICSKLNHPGICMMGDFYHMCKEEKDDEAAFVTAGKWLHHVHLASRARNLPGQDDRSFVAGFRGLKKIGYQDYCSLECGVKGKPEEEIPKSFRFLEQQWKEATV